MERRGFLAAALAAGLYRPSDRLTDRPSSFHAPPDPFLRDLPRLLELAAVPGLSAAVVTGGKTAWSAGFGLTGGEHSAPVTADTIFEAASLSKPVFAYTALQLVQEGKLDLDRPLDSYLPSPYVPGNDLAALVTARHVLSHTTGYRNWRFSKTQVLAPEFKPGERWQYSGEGYYELERVVETITGKSLTALAQERVFVPLGMKRSSYIPLPEFDLERALGHSRDGAVTAPPPADPGSDLPVMLTPNAAGSLRTCATDYAKFLAVMSGAVTGPLGEPLRASMTRRQVTIRGPLGWGLGWGLEDRDGRTLLWHWGDNPGFKNFVIVDPAPKEGMVVFTNGDGGRAIYERVVRAAAGFDPGAFVWLQ